MALPGWPHGGSPFHRGEQTLQTRAGVRDRLEALGRRVVRDYMPEQHREFYAQLPLIVVGSVDDTGQPHASMWFGEPGFITSPDPRHLRIARRPASDDPLAGNVRAGHDLGLLGIDLYTRRRNRLNGRIATASASGIGLEVGQSFGNCAQYIQKRIYEPVRWQATDTSQSTALEAVDIELLQRADTFFIASHYAEPGQPFGTDVSHRGGKSGFVRIEHPATLLWPEFPGNSHYNTLGNLLLQPRCGLVVPDFDTGTLLHLSGEATVLWDTDGPARHTGAPRFVRFRITRVLRRSGALPWKWTFEEWSPALERVGAWRIG